MNMLDILGPTARGMTRGRQAVEERKRKAAEAMLTKMLRELQIQNEQQKLDLNKGRPEREEFARWLDLAKEGVDIPESKYRGLQSLSKRVQREKMLERLKTGDESAIRAAWEDALNLGVPERTLNLMIRNAQKRAKEWGQGYKKGELDIQKKERDLAKANQPPEPEPVKANLVSNFWKEVNNIVDSSWPEVISPEEAYSKVLSRWKKRFGRLPEYKQAIEYIESSVKDEFSSEGVLENVAPPFPYATEIPKGSVNLFGAPTSGGAGQLSVPTPATGIRAVIGMLRSADPAEKAQGKIKLRDMLVKINPEYANYKPEDFTDEIIEIIIKGLQQGTIGIK